MRKAAIWDLDGTLFDSYDVIVESICQVIYEVGIEMSAETVRKHALEFSIQSLFADVCRQYSVSMEQMNERYGQISRGKYLQIKPMANAMAVLEQLHRQGVEHYVFTHRGRTTVPVLEHLQIDRYFREVLTSQSGFARKPDPQALSYLIEKYALDPDQTYYVGDRPLDMQCAANAGIHGILYMPKNSILSSCTSADYVVADLMDVLSII